MSQSQVDSITSWFLAGEELGEYIGIRFGRIAPGEKEPEWVFLRHTDYDGIGGLGEILRQRGAILERLPQIKYPASPSQLMFLKLLPKFLAPRRRVKWRPLERRAAAIVPGPPGAVAWHVFDEAATSRMRRVCRKFGVTINSFLLKHLTKALRPFLQDESSMIPWMIPVNLRGKVVRDRDTANYSSYVAVQVQSYETVHEVHRNIYAALARGEHWAHWQGYQLGGWMSNGLKKKLIAKELAMPQWHLGSFSNIGDWDPEKKITQAACLGDWLFSPPVLRSQMIGAGCVTFQNRLSLTIQAHSDLTTSPQAVETWIKNWVKEIEIDLPGG